MDEIKQEIDKIKEILIQDFEPLAIILFGSYARGTQNKDSDIDIAIVSTKRSKLEMFNEKQKLEEIILKDIGLVNLNDENISDGFRYEVLMNGVVIYCTDTYKFTVYKLDMFREYLELNESRQEIIRRVKEGGTIYGE